MLSRSQCARVRPNYAHSSANWEADIEDVAVVSCGMDEDPTGYRVVFYKDPRNTIRQDDVSYSIGASYLKNRLDKLLKAGFDAPMTEKAINMIDERRLERVVV